MNRVVIFWWGLIFPQIISEVFVYILIVATCVGLQCTKIRIVSVVKIVFTLEDEAVSVRAFFRTSLTWNFLCGGF